MAKIYILKAKGPLLFFPTSYGTPMCQKAFRSLEAAEAAKPGFIKNCTTSLGPEDLGTLESVLNITVLELELED